MWTVVYKNQANRGGLVQNRYHHLLININCSQHDIITEKLLIWHSTTTAHSVPLPKIDTFHSMTPVKGTHNPM
jgi:hypothetical protein